MSGATATLSARVTPASLVRGVSGLVVLWNTAFIVVYARGHSHYVGDDVLGFWQARTLPFIRYLRLSIDVHPVPLHRLVSYALAWTAPMNFEAGLLVLTVLQLGTLYAFYRALDALAPSPATPVLVAVYGSHVYLGVLFFWWTAALHRIPYLGFTAVALFGYARFRKQPGLLRALGVVLPYLAALGFFEKGALFPALLAAVELCLYPSTPSAGRLKNVALIAALFALSAAHYLAWRLSVNPLWVGIGWDRAFLLEHTRLSWIMLLRTCAGQAYEHGFLGVLALAAPCAFAVWRRPWNAVVLLAGFLVVSLYLAITGLSAAKAQFWSFTLAVYAHRYYPDVFFVLLLFVGLALHGALGEDGVPRAAPWSEKARFRAALVTCVLIVLNQTTSEYNVGKLAALYYPNGPALKYFRDRVASGMLELERRGVPLVFVDGKVPYFVDVIRVGTARHSTLLLAMGYTVHFQKRGGPGVYRIDPLGDVVPAPAPPPAP